MRSTGTQLYMGITDSSRLPWKLTHYRGPCITVFHALPCSTHHHGNIAIAMEMFNTYR